MASAKEFVACLLGIEGVQSCMLMRKDGQLLHHNFEDPDTVSSLMIIAAMGAEGIKDKAGLSYFRHLVFARAGRNNLFVFPLGRYFLGIVQQPDASSKALTESLMAFLAGVSTDNSSA